MKKTAPVVIILLAFIYIMALGHVLVMSETPFSDNTDSIYYMGKALGIMENGLDLPGAWDAYNFTPLLFFLMIALAKTAGLGVAMAASSLVVFQIVALGLAFFILAREIMKSDWAALFVSIGGLAAADQFFWDSHALAPFILLRAQKFSFLLFLVLAWVGLKYLRQRNTRLILPIYLLSGCMLLFHHQSGLAYWLIFYLFFIYALARSKENGRLVLGTTIAIAFLPALAAIGLDIIYSGQVRALIADPGSAENLAWRSPDLYLIFGATLVLAGLAGLCFLIFGKRDEGNGRFLLISYFLIMLVGASQVLWGGRFFPERFAAELVYPLIFLSGVFLVRLARSKRALTAAAIGILICGLGCGAMVTGLAKVKFSLPWKYFQAADWARKNLDKEGMFLADVNTTIQFSQLTGLTPAVEIERTRKLNKHNEDEAYRMTIGQEEIIILEDYMAANGIKYFIYDSRMSPRSTPGNYDLVLKNDAFREIFSIEIKEGKTLRIFELIP